MTKSQLIFGIRNIFDKAKLILKQPRFLVFYLQHYFFSRLQKIEPKIFVISYPKSGRTWLRNMFDEYQQHYGKGDAHILRKDWYSLADGRVLAFDHHHSNWVPFPKQISRMHIDLSRFKNKKVIFLMRDPRDVLISSWYHLKFRENAYTNDLSSFLRDNLLGAEKCIEFIRMWLNAGEHLDEFLVVKYEDLSNSPNETFQKLLNFCDLPYDEETIASVVANTSFDSLKKKESDAKASEPWMSSAKGRDPKARKIRSGKVGGYVDEMTPPDIEFINRHMKDRIPQKWGYF